MAVIIRLTNEEMDGVKQAAIDGGLAGNVLIGIDRMRDEIDQGRLIDRKTSAGYLFEAIRGSDEKRFRLELQENRDSGLFRIKHESQVYNFVAGAFVSPNSPLGVIDDAEVQDDFDVMVDHARTLVQTIVAS